MTRISQKFRYYVVAQLGIIACAHLDGPAFVVNFAFIMWALYGVYREWV